MTLHRLLSELDLSISSLELNSLEKCIADINDLSPQALYRSCQKHTIDYHNPILPLVVTGMLCCHNRHYIPIIKDIIKTRLFRNNKRIPFLELKFWLFLDLGHKNLISQFEFDLLYTAIKLGYHWPSIVGTALNEFAYKDSSYQYSDEMNQIITAQISLGKGDLNKTTMITQTKGGLSLDLGYGCPMGCAYCYRVSDCTEQYVKQWQPDFFITPQEIVHRLLNHPWFTPHITPLGIMMSTTEAFLPNVWPTTYSILTQLDELKLTNRITLITKYNVDEGVLAQLNSLKFVDIDLCICYSNLPRSVEPASSALKLNAFTHSDTYQNITMIGYYRPIIEGYNTSEEKIRETLKQYKQSGVKTIVIGGLKFTEDHIDNFVSRNLDLPAKFKLGGKFISEETVSRISRIFTEIFGHDTDVRLLRRSSCARVAARGYRIPDYNCHFYYRETLKGCDPYCAISSLCTQLIIPTKQEVEDLLKRIGKLNMHYEISSKGLYLANELSMYERSFLVQNLFVPVFYSE